MFVSIYDFFRRHLIFCLVLFLATLGLSGYLASRLTFQEDITSMLPDSKAIHAMNDVISHTQAGEQIIFIMSFKDMAISNPDSLIAASGAFQEQLHQRCGPWIDTINMQMGSGMEEALVDIFQNNVPLFLTQKDY